MASGDYGNEEIGEEVACQRARVNDVLKVNSICARGLVRFKAIFPFGVLVNNSKRVSGIYPGHVSIVSGLSSQLRLIIPLRCLVGKEMLEGMFVSAVNFIRKIKWESVLSMKWGLEEYSDRCEKVG